MRALTVVIASLALAAPAGAQETRIIERAIVAYRTQNVYVHPGTDVLTPAEARKLERNIESEALGPVFIAILPEAARGEAGGTSTGVVVALSRRVFTSNPPAVHAVVVGNQFRAVNRDIPAGDLATAAFQAHRDQGVVAVLYDFVHRVGEARAEQAQPVEVGERKGESEGSSFWIVGLVIGAAALVGFIVVRRRRRAARELAEVKAAANDDLVALAEDVTGLDEQVEGNQQAKEAYTRAMEGYQRADDAFDRARSPRDIAPVTSALAEARFDMETAKALLAGRPPPERRSPCFFDPRHGPSVRDVWWDSPFRGPVRVPACEMDARHIEAGEEPESRQVTVGGRRRPFWDAPAYYSPWAGGFYGGGLLPGLLAGSLLGATFAGPADAYAGSTEGSDLGGDGDFGDGGDLGGGGDFGGDGGDFGGGGDF